MTTPYAPPQPQYYGPPSAGPGGPPPRNKALPWVIGALVALLIVAGVLVFLLLTRDGDTSTAAPAPASTASSSPVEDDDAAEPTPTDEDATPVDQGATPAGEEPYVDEGGLVTGSADRAADFLDAVVLGDYATALGHGGSEFQAYYGGDVELLEQEVLTATAGAQAVDYTIDTIEYNAEVDADQVWVTVELPDGTSDDMFVLVGEEGTSTVVVGFL